MCPPGRPKILVTPSASRTLTIACPAAICSIAHPPGLVAAQLLPNRYTLYTVEFEFDPRKSRSNRDKHGIDFIAAQRLWEDPDLIAVPARTMDEPRELVVGRIGELHWSAVITSRGDRVRIISVRRSRIEEIELYEG